ncbi:LacI family transcriptional regulator [Natronospirillum operosum]|uniref:LacI family transcriptional regulator n=1 Tax=Natronospirillum operosum TaxID=2759953 RepID=A0A4Z0W463_9GAMM|nr:SpoIIE family protein phosphatase [Natronospirillum operosum]TGG92094.1 LacI family transcriptional regulator [Natronospirillum operosum]
MKRHQIQSEVSEAVSRNNFQLYQTDLVHKWLRTVTALVFGLVPLFFLLDIIMLPAALIPQFAAYRAVSTALALGQYLIIRNTPPGRLSYLHGYFASMQVGSVIALMTVALGGFDHGYYAGLILVIIGVSLVLPWRGKHTAVNAAVIVAMYLGFNLYYSQPYDPALLANNLFFLVSAGIIAVAISELRHRLIANEFNLMVELKQARDSLWGEMELAKDIQMSLLPKNLDLPGYDIAASMQPALEVGGDYYEVVETRSGARYVAIGDVAGHGLSAGLIMMMVQTSLQTVLKADPDCSPVKALETINGALRANVCRMGSDHYMTLSILKLGADSMEVAGHHQDILLYRSASRSLEVVPTTGTWLGIIDSLEGFHLPVHIPIKTGDVVMLFTDGLTEATDKNGALFGQQQLEHIFLKHAISAPTELADRIQRSIQNYQHEQNDDMTLLVLRKTEEQNGATGSVASDLKEVGS